MGLPKKQQTNIHTDKNKTHSHDSAAIFNPPPFPLHILNLTQPDAVGDDDNKMNPGANWCMSLFVATAADADAYCFCRWFVVVVIILLGLAPACVNQSVSQLFLMIIRFAQTSHSSEYFEHEQPAQQLFFA